MTTLTQEDLLRIGEVVSTQINPLIDTINALSTRLATVENKVNSVENKVNSVENKVNMINTKIGVMEAKQANSVKGREDQLVVVPNDDGVKPTNIAYPYCVAQLVVAGSEGIPGMAERSHWSAGDSDKLLKFYGEELSASESSGDESEGRRKTKQKERARVRRLRVASRIGVTRVQLNYAQLSL